MATVQACISQLCALTRLDVSGIRTPVESPTLNTVFASLPALQSVCLAFRPKDPIYATDYSDDEFEFIEGAQPRMPKPQYGFPGSLLRCVARNMAR